jgi:tRNA(fMet)-specific endonuclease VapC
MLVLDTDVFSIITRAESQEAVRVRDRLRASGERDAISIVTVEERMRGRLAACHRATTPEQYAAAARLLHETLEECGTVRILGFTTDAIAEFRRLKAAKIRIGTPDLRIAAIVLANDVTLITRNLSDFRKVPQLRAEDWTRQ